MTDGDGVEQLLAGEPLSLPDQVALQKGEQHVTRAVQDPADRLHGVGGCQRRLGSPPVGKSCSMTDDLDALVSAAHDARSRAYVPYSQFSMGAAVRAEDGTIVQGALVENVSLGLAMCAERVALFGTATAGRRPVSLALVAARTDGQVTTPCGACLQVALELGGPQTAVVAVAADGSETFRSTVGELLPHGPRKRP